MSIWLRVNGVPLYGIGAWGELTWSHLAQGGCKDATWKMDLAQSFFDPALQTDRDVQVMHAAQCVWGGLLTEPDPDDEWSFTALGYSTFGADYLCLDGFGNTTSTPDVAIDRAIAAGLPWVRRSSISSVPFGSSDDETTSFNTVTDLLDAYADSVGQRWGVNANHEVYCVADPTSPSWYMTPGSGRLGLADDDFATHLYGRYLDPSGVYATALAADTAAAARYRRREFAVDMSGLGAITSTAATAALASKLTLGKARLGYTNAVSANSWELTNTGATQASFPLVQAGQMVRMFGVYDEQGMPLPRLDWVIGETSCTAGSDVIGLSPVGLASRDLSSALSFPEAS